MANYEHVRRLFAAIADDRTARRVTKIIDRKLTLKITRARPVDLREKAETYILTVGPPNYAERQFIKDCIAAGEPFPIKKYRVERWPQKR